MWKTAFKNFTYSTLKYFVLYYESSCHRVVGFSDYLYLASNVHLYTLINFHKNRTFFTRKLHLERVSSFQFRYWALEFVDKKVKNWSICDKHPWKTPLDEYYMIYAHKIATFLCSFFKLVTEALKLQKNSDPPITDFVWKNYLRITQSCQKEQKNFLEKNKKIVLNAWVIDVFSDELVPRKNTDMHFLGN